MNLVLLAIEEAGNVFGHAFCSASAEMRDEKENSRTLWAEHGFDIAQSNESSAESEVTGLTSKSAVRWYSFVDSGEAIALGI